jgi:hypothetical protein
MVTYSSEYPRSMKYDNFYSHNLIIVSDHVANSHLSICKAWRINIIRNSILLQWNRILFKQWPKITLTYILTRGPKKDWKQSSIMCVAVLMNIHKTHYILNTYWPFMGSVTTLMTIAEAKQRQPLVRIHYVYLFRK